MRPSDGNSEPLTSQQTLRVHALLDELLDLPPDARLDALAARTGEDPRVLAETESLLRADRAAGTFMADSARIGDHEAPPDPLIGSHLESWRITRLIGRGGMGEVYEGVRTAGGFEQRVAIKFLQREAAAQSGRFESERRILARLEHPGIARLYDGGITRDGRPFMAMEYVEGRTILEFCSERAAGFQQRLLLFVQVCEAVAYAHRNLVVHRDLKASNILVTPDGTVKLLDFGIAKLLDARDTGLTQATIAPLTPVCAAPEQLTGGPITTATDVYALGLLLFELLSGVQPWTRADHSVMQAMRTVLQNMAPAVSRSAAANAASPVPPRLIRGDLDAIVAKCLRTEPERRYAGAESLGLEIRRVLDGTPVQAREGARLYVVGRFLRRYRWGVVAVAAIVVSLAAGLAATAWQAHRAAIERDASRRDAAREEAVRYSLTRLFRSAIADQGSQAPTAKKMIELSAERVLREYRDQPQLKGELVLTLADLYAALEDVAGARALLEGYVAAAHTGEDSATLADARQKLAGMELLQGHADRAAELLARADAYWMRTPGPYREERLEGLVVRARLQRTRGDFAGSIATTQEAIQERIALSGRDHRETASLYNTLAITLAAAGRTEEALDAYHETSAIYRAAGLGDELDAQVVLANTGTLALRAGRLGEAETLLKTAYEQQRLLAGDSAAVAAAMGSYGHVLSITNRTAAAVAVLVEATRLAEQYAGPGSPLTIQNRLFLGDAQMLSGDLAAAGTSFRAAADTALKQYGPASVVTLRSQLSLAQLAVAQGNLSGARTQLDGVVAGLRKLGPQGESSLAPTLDTLGEVAIGLGESQEAVTALREAAALREKTHSPAWEIANTQVLLGEAVTRTGGDATAQLREARQQLETQLGADHPWTLRAKLALDHVAR